MSKSEKITHKELLTFSNLTNLEWEFADLTVNSDDPFASEERYKKLNDLLDPEVFARRDADGNILRYIYGSDDEGNYLGEDMGLAEMRMKAGIAMEYLEKWQDEDNPEGEFLGEWEVIYGGDNYKIVTDYLDDIYLQLAQSEETEFNEEDLKNMKIYPEREEVEEAKEAIEKIEHSYNAIDELFSIAVSYLSLGKVGNNGFTEEVLGKIKEGLSKNAVTSIASRVDSFPIKLLSLAYDSDNLLDMTAKASGKLKNKTVEGLLDKTVIKDLSEIVSNTSVRISQELKLSDTGFRVLVLKKADDIVITYKGNKVEDRELLPEELDNLDIVYQRIRKQYEEENIKLTGYEGGADLAFINTLNCSEEEDISATLFYDKVEEIEGFMNFTEEDIDKEYKSSIKIIVKSESKDLLDEIAKKSFHTLLSAGLILTIGKKVTLIALSKSIVGIIILAIITFGFSILKEYIKKGELERRYNRLIEKDFLLREHKGFKGYIRDKLLENYIELETDEGEKIKIKREHAILLILNNTRLSISKYDNEIYKTAYQSTLLDRDEIKLYNEAEKRADKDLAGRIAIPGQKENLIREYYKELKEEQEKIIKYWRLEKNTSSSIYEIKGFVLEEEGSRVKQDLYQEAKDEITEAIMFTNLLVIIGTMQRNYSDKTDNTFEFIYMQEEGVKLTNDLSEALEDNQNKGERDYHPNEHIFMPFIDENGDFINANHKLKIREEYIASFLKSKIIQDIDWEEKKNNLESAEYYSNILGNNYNRLTALYLDKVRDYDEEFNMVKMGLEEELPGDYLIDLQQERFDDYLKEVLENRDLHNFIRRQRIKQKATNHSNYSEKYTPFNHQKIILKQIEQTPEVLENIYEKYDDEIFREGKNPAGDLIHFLGFNIWTHLTGKAVINPGAKSKIEYKYNPADLILGGELELYLENISEEVIEMSEEESNKYSYNYLAIRPEIINHFPDDFRNAVEKFSFEENTVDESKYETMEIDKVSNFEELLDDHLIVENNDYANKREDNRSLLGKLNLS